MIADAFSRYCINNYDNTSSSTTSNTSSSTTNNINFVNAIYYNESGEALEDFEYACAITDAFTIPNDVYERISQLHNMSVGHGGVERTMEKLKEKRLDFGTSTREYVRWFIKNCPCCQKMSHLKVPIHTRPFTTSRYNVMERVAIDSVGPYPEDEYGNKYIIVMIDSFSRYTVLFTARDTTALSAAKALLQFVGKFGCPAELLSDNGSQYVNNTIKHLAELIGTKHILTMAYSKEENALVERANKEVVRHLRAIIFEINATNDWSDRLPLIERILNTEKHSSTGVSPAKLIFGNSIDLDRGILNPLSSGTANPENLGTWTSRMLETQRELIERARTVLQS